MVLVDGGWTHSMFRPCQHSPVHFPRALCLSAKHSPGTLQDNNSFLEWPLMNPGRCLFLIKGHHTLGSRFTDVFRDYIGHECILELFCYFYYMWCCFPRAQPALWMLLHLTSSSSTAINILFYFKDESRSWELKWSITTAIPEQLGFLLN